MPDNTDLINVPLPGTLAAGNLLNIPLQENAELAAVTVGLATATSGGTTVFDVLDKGVSLFTTPIGTVRQGVNPQAPNATPVVVQATDTQIEVTPGPVGIGPDIGEVITIDSEDLLVTGVGGDYKTVQSGRPEYLLTVTRGFNGTTPATHAANAPVLPSKPKVVSGATQSAGRYVPYPTSANVPPISSGDNITVSVLAVASTPGGGGAIEIEFIQR